MKVILFGGSGMVGQGVLRECLLAPDVSQVVSIVRAQTGQEHAKLRELVHADLMDLTSIEDQLAGGDACFYCLGVTSMGLTEEQYRSVTLDLTIAVASTLQYLNPDMTFIFVSGKGSDSGEHGMVMWARVKGAAENAVLRMFRKGYAFRPGIIQPMHGIKSKTRSYRVGYAIMKPLLPLLRRFTSQFTTTEQMGRAMLAVARHGSRKRILESEDINAAH